jgi:hypothetical protein
VALDQVTSRSRASPERIPFRSGQVPSKSRASPGRVPVKSQVGLGGSWASPERVPAGVPGGYRSSANKFEQVLFMSGRVLGRS